MFFFFLIHICIYIYIHIHMCALDLASGAMSLFSRRPRTAAAALRQALGKLVWRGICEIARCFDLGTLSCSAGCCRAMTMAVASSLPWSGARRPPKSMMRKVPDLPHAGGHGSLLQRGSRSGDGCRPTRPPLAVKQASLAPSLAGVVRGPGTKQFRGLLRVLYDDGSQYHVAPRAWSEESTLP